MANKTVTIFEPTASKINSIILNYEDGVFQNAQVNISFATDNPDSPAQYHNVVILASDLPAPRVTNLTNLAGDALTFIKNKFGF